MLVLANATVGIPMRQAHTPASLPITFYSNKEDCDFGPYLTGLVCFSITPSLTNRCSHSFAWLFDTCKSAATSASVFGVFIFPSNSRTLANSSSAGAKGDSTDNKEQESLMGSKLFGISSACLASSQTEEKGPFCSGATFIRPASTASAAASASGVSGLGQSNAPLRRRASSPLPVCPFERT